MAAAYTISCVNLANCIFAVKTEVSHDYINRFLSNKLLDPNILFEEAKAYIDLKSGYLIIDDTVIDKPHSKYIAMTYYQWSGRHHKVVKGIGLVTLLWTNGIISFPVDFRIYDIKNDGKTKNDHFRDMLRIAHSRGFRPKKVLFDNWYSGIDNLKTLRFLKFNWLTRFKKNRMVNPDNTVNVQIQTLDIPDEGYKVYLKEYGYIRVFRTEVKEGVEVFWATSDTDMGAKEREYLQSVSWKIENYHRALKQLCCVQKCIARKETIQRNHILCSLRAFVRFEIGVISKEITSYAAKQEIQNVAVQTYLLEGKTCAF